MKKKSIEVGDPVQWVCAGSYQFEKSKIVVRIIDDPVCGPYAFVGGSSTGIPVSELILWRKN
jgi:hypothetical protein